MVSVTSQRMGICHISEVKLVVYTAAQPRSSNHMLHNAQSRNIGWPHQVMKYYDRLAMFGLSAGMPSVVLIGRYEVAQHAPIILSALSMCIHALEAWPTANVTKHLSLSEKVFTCPAQILNRARFLALGQHSLWYKWTEDPLSIRPWPKQIK